MAVSINWDTKVIFVPKADLTLIQLLPTEIRELNIDWFRLQLKDLEDSEEGMVFLDTHVHYAPVDVGGVTLAMVIEIINGYTVTFEDGMYAVNLVGANSNIGDRVNVNQVSVRSFNSAGLISSADIEFASYDSMVCIDINSGYSGTSHPVGTLRQPVNNLVDALLIAQYRGLNKLNFLSDYTFGPTVFIQDMLLYGQNIADTVFTFQSGCILAHCSIYQAKCTGLSLGATYFNNCWLSDFGSPPIFDTTSDIIVQSSLLEGTISIPSTYDGHFKVTDCKSGYGGMILNTNGSKCQITVRGWIGKASIVNSTHGNFRLSVDMLSGNITLDNSNTGGTFIIRGVGLFNNTSVGPTIDVQYLLNSPRISEFVWNHIQEGAFTAQQVMEIFLSVLAGKSIIQDLGGGNAIVKFRDLLDTKDVVTADMAGSERQNITLNP